MLEIQDKMKLMKEKFEDMEVKSFAREVIEFIDECPSTYHVAKNCSDILEENGFERLIPQEKWHLKKGGKYYVKKSNSTVVAFALGTDINFKKGFKIFGSHTDSPGFRIKPNPEMVTENILRLNTEVYGGPILSTWFDRPLSIAGRVVVKSDNLFLPRTVRVKIEEPLMIIPNLAIHQNREVNNGVKIDKQMDTLPVLGLINSQFEKDDYLKVIKKTIDYIIEGDIYIMNLTQRLMIESKKSPLQVFSYLRKYNPAPFGAYLDFDNFEVVSASPERFIKMKNKLIETRPIKGTRKRGATEEEDLALKNELANSEKDKSELLMIVDLERNDLNRICELKSVVVDELFEVETYSTVFHLVSTIRGKLKEEYSFVDLIKATFPGGSITGAPKIRAMEIIDELENSRRDLYTGSIGYISFNGDCDLNIVIRTAIHKDGKYYLGVGGGITCESELEFEYEETLQKAKAILEAIC